MTILIVLILVIVVIAIVLWRREKNVVDNRPNADVIKTKHDHLSRTLSFARDRGTITNNDIENLLGVSDATAERYLNELEAEGELVQVGGTGRGVKYSIKK
jgi:Fic family protein